jgi:Rps23 Pro-64 3,4-dihydroxylase Tpa1-like proline 4-hydroxylase
VRVTAKLTEPFPVFVIEDLLPLETSVYAWRHRPPLDNPNWVRYSNACESKKSTMCKAEQFGVFWNAYADIFSALSSPEVVGELSEIAGIPGLRADPDRWGAGLHITEPGGHLSPHLDFAVHPLHPELERRVSLIHFLSPEWETRYGGAFIACDILGKPVCDIYPRFNTSVVFLNSDVSLHGTTEQSLDSPPRVTLASYYMGPKRPGAVRQRAMYLPPR